MAIYKISVREKNVYILKEVRVKGNEKRPQPDKGLILRPSIENMGFHLLIKMLLSTCGLPEASYLIHSRVIFLEMTDLKSCSFYNLYLPKQE